MIPEALLGQLPNLHFVTLLGGQRTVAGRLPLVKDSGDGDAAGTGR